MDNLSKEQRHRNMQNIKGTNTSIENILAKALWNKGYRYRRNYKKLPGKPDIVLTKYKIAIFCDGEFWHGKNWGEEKFRLQKSNNSEFWIKKISKNIERDNEVNSSLDNSEWTVLRFWGKDIKKHTYECIKAIEDTINELELQNILDNQKYIPDEDENDFINNYETDDNDKKTPL